MTESRDHQPRPRPDTSKNGLLKKNQLTVRDDKIRERGRSILKNLGQNRVDEQDKT
ncbi:hypothetical protein [Brevibacillus sp. SYSU BS000544]|uniref:hypothetical protein n=1 Tax=Brevibacillus sp. SYSU BS000544 TaxID=3416443 RepID=UPI003CE57C0F